MLSAPTASSYTGREVSVPGVPIVEPIVVVILVGSGSDLGSEFEAVGEDE